MSDTKNENDVQKKTDVEKKQGFFARIALFFRQIFSELKKVQRPTPQELWDIFITVIVFVAILMVVVGALDALFQWLTLLVFAS